jgi:hypothetical protein
VCGVMGGGAGGVLYPRAGHDETISALPRWRFTFRGGARLRLLHPTYVASEGEDCTAMDL